MSEGFVYAIAEMGKDGILPSAVKFGITTGTIDKRLSSLQTGNPNKLVVLSILIFSSEEIARMCEKLIHYNLSSHRMEGEWFSLNEEVVDFIDNGFPRYGYLLTKPVNLTELFIARKKSPLMVVHNG